MKEKQEDKLEDKLIVVKGNPVVEASYRLTLQEQRVMLYIISQINRSDEDFKPVKISISDFMSLIDAEGNDYYKKIRSIGDSLRKRDLELRDNEAIMRSGWISSVKYYYQKGYVEFRIDPNLKPYLLQLKERFTRYRLKHVIRLSHSYSVRFYELLKQYESIGWRYFELDKLMRILGIEGEYKLYANFKNRVLKPVKEEFDIKYSKGELDFTFDFEEVKESRKVIGIRFVILKTKQLESEVQEKAEISKTDIGAETLVNELLAMKLTKRQANSKVKKYPAERIARNIELTKQKNAKGEVDNVPAFLIDAIENDYAKDYNPASPKLAELRAKARRCWDGCRGICGGTWERYKDDQSNGCHFCYKFEKQRVTM